MDHDPTIGSNYVRLSVEFRTGLSRYVLSELESKLAHKLCLESYDKGLPRGVWDLEEWARLLGLMESGLPRSDKCLRFLKALEDLGLVYLNEVERTFELRPDLAGWSRERPLRGRDRRRRAVGHPELNLRAERPLDEALSAVRRDNALSGPRARPPTAESAAEGPTAESAAAGATYIHVPCHDHDHASEHALNSMSHAKGGRDNGKKPPMIGSNPSREWIRSRVEFRKFDVGDAGEQSGKEIFDVFLQAIRHTPAIEVQEAWWRRIEEKAGLVWNLAQEARQRHDLDNPIGWMNRSYMREMKIGKFSE